MGKTSSTKGSPLDLIDYHTHPGPVMKRLDHKQGYPGTDPPDESVQD